MSGGVTGSGRVSPVSYGSTSSSSSTDSKSPLLNRAAKLFVDDAKKFVKENDGLLACAALAVVVAGAILGLVFGPGHVHANMDALKWSGVAIGGASGLALLARFGYSMHEVHEEDEAEVENSTAGHGMHTESDEDSPSLYSPREL